MRGSVILFSGTKQDRQDKVVEIIEAETSQKLNWKYLSNVSDVKLVEPLGDKKSIGIAQIKEGIAFLGERPFKLDLKILIVFPADVLTIEAQNALLKTLEEPPKYALVLLLTKSENALISTVISRCKKVRVFRDQENVGAVSNFISLESVLNKTSGQLLDWIEEFSKEEKDTIIETLEDWVIEGEALLSKGEYAKNVDVLLGKISTALEGLQNTNVSSRSCLECLFLGE